MAKTSSLGRLSSGRVAMDFLCAESWEPGRIELPLTRLGFWFPHLRTLLRGTPFKRAEAPAFLPYGEGGPAACVRLHKFDTWTELRTRLHNQSKTRTLFIYAIGLVWWEPQGRAFFIARYAALPKKETPDAE